MNGKLQTMKEDDKMYSLVLLDDEKIVLQGIQKVFHLEDYGFQVTGAFNNPLKALENLEELKPDLIITDVKMPQMDGLEFSARVKEILPDTEIVILSGYNLHHTFRFPQVPERTGFSTLYDCSLHISAKIHSKPPEPPFPRSFCAFL